MGMPLDTSGENLLPWEEDTATPRAPGPKQGRSKEL